MRNSLLVAWREYAENARTKGFWIGILLLPIILFLSFQVPIFLETSARPTRQFVIADFTGRYERVVVDSLERQYQRQVMGALGEYARAHLAPDATRPEFLSWRPESTEALGRFIEAGGHEHFLNQLRPSLRADAPPFNPPRRMYQQAELPVAGGVDPESLAAELRPWLRGESKLPGGASLDSALIITDGNAGANGGTNSEPASPALQYWAANLAEKSLRNLAESALNDELRRLAYLDRGLDPALYAEIERIRIPVEELNPRKEQGSERVTQAEVIAQWAPVGFVYLLWIAIFSISQMLLNNTIEEKSNRIIEVLLSSVTAAEFVIGKLLGIAAVGLTMVGAWIGSFLLLILWKSTGMESDIPNQFLALLVASPLLPAFMVYFTFGYLLYAALILAVGSVCNTLKEAQNYMAAITMLMVVPLLTMMFIPRDPHGTLATVLSWIPLYTPFVMMNRAAAHPPLFDLIGTMLLLIVTTLLALWGAVKIFRAGVLRTGQPPRLIEILRWLRQ